MASATVSAYSPSPAESSSLGRSGATTSWPRLRSWITTVVRSKVHSSPTNPLAPAPSSRACSTVASWASDSRGAGPLGPRLRSASAPPSCQRACQTLTAWAETPSWRATSAWRRPAANGWAARTGGSGAGHVLVVPQGGERQLTRSNGKSTTTWDAYRSVPIGPPTRTPMLLAASVPNPGRAAAGIPSTFPPPDARPHGASHPTIAMRTELNLG
jgi:hypothetical protein